MTQPNERFTKHHAFSGMLGLLFGSTIFSVGWLSDDLMMRWFDDLMMQ
jgi:hypothetical protein